MTEKELMIELETYKSMISELRKRGLNIENEVINRLYLRCKQEVLERPMLTDREKAQIRRFLNGLKDTTGHTYKSIQFCEMPVRHTKLYHDYDDNFDTITGWDIKNRLKENKLYTLSSLGV